MSSLPVAATHPASRSARLSSAELRELSRQWRQRVDEDPDKVRRIAAALDWLASQRETPPRAGPRALALTLALWQQGLALLRTRFARANPAP